MAAQLIILERQVGPPQVYSYIMWADVPAARQPYYAQAGLTSAYKGASTAENNALASGAVVEHQETIQIPSGATLPQIQALLKARLDQYQIEVTAYNPWLRYGTRWNGTAWVPGGVA